MIINTELLANFILTGYLFKCVYFRLTVKKKKNS